MLIRKPPPKSELYINGFVCYRRKRLSQDTYFKTSNINSKCVLVTEIGASLIVLGQDITGVVISIAHVSYRNSLKPL